MATQPTDFLSGLGGLANLPRPYDVQQEVAQNQNALRTSQLQQQAAALQLNQQQQAAQRQQQFQTDLATLGANPSPDGIAGMIRKYPEFSKQLKDSHDIQDEAARDSQFRLQSQIYAAAQGGRYDLAAQLLRSHRDASVKAGEPVDPTDDAIITALESNDPKEQKNALSMIGLSVASINPDKFNETYRTLNPAADKGRVVRPGDIVLDGDNKPVYTAPDAAPKTELKEVKTVHADGSETTQWVPVNPDGTIAAPRGNASPAVAGGAPVGEAIEAAVKSAVPGAVITSGLRSPEHNAAVGGVPNSYHLTDQARDVVPPPGMSMAQFGQTVQAALPPGTKIINEGTHLHIQPVSRNVQSADAAAPQPGGPASFVTKVASDSSGSPIPDNLSGQPALDYLQHKNPGLGNRIAGIMAGKIPYPATNRKDTQPILNAISQVDPTFDATVWKARNKAASDYSPGGSVGKQILSGQTAVNHLYDLALAAQKLPDHYFGWANSLSNGVAPVGSNQGENLIRFNRSRTLYAPEVSKFLAGTGVAPEAETKKHYESFSPSLGKTGALNSLATDVKFITDKFDPLASSYEETMGKPLSIDGQGKTAGPATAKLAALRWWSENQSQPIPTVVTSPAQATKLPSGTMIVTPDGRVLKTH